MTYLALLLPVLALPGLLGVAAFERRCSDRASLVPASLASRSRRGAHVDRHAERTAG